jgi:hypothetical protein
MPDTQGEFLPGAAALQEDGFLYVFAPSRREDPARPVGIARWRVEDARAGDLRRGEWWRGAEEGWKPFSCGARPAPLFYGGQTEFSVHRDRGRFLCVQTVGFGAARIAARTAPALTGPWSAPVEFYTPPEGPGKDNLVYAAKAHPELGGEGLAVSYMVNTLDRDALLTDESLYFPKFLKVIR